MNFENFSNHPIASIVACAFVVILWSIIGRLIFRFYVTSAWEFRTELERLLVLVCGPSVWWTTFRLWRKQRHWKQLDALRDGM